MAAKTIQLTPLALETRTALPTPEAAGHLNRAQQTLRIWACREDGPVRPIRIGRRLNWPTKVVKELCGVAQ